MFVRKDIPLQDQFVQALHAVERLYSIYQPEEEVPNIIAIGVRNTASLNRVLGIIKDNQVPHYAWSEPDNDLGFTSIATIPIDSEQKKVFEKYRLWIDNTGGELASDTCTNVPSIC